MNYALVSLQLSRLLESLEANVTYRIMIINLESLKVEMMKKFSLDTPLEVKDINAVIDEESKCTKKEATIDDEDTPTTSGKNV